MPIELAAQVSESIATWESITWQRVVLCDGSRLDPRDVPDAQALAEDTLGGGMLRSSGPDKGRSVIWRVRGNSLWLVELDATNDLSNNALQLVFPSELRASPWAVAAFDGERSDPTQPASLVLCVLTADLCVYRLVFSSPPPHADASTICPSVLSSAASCRSDGDAVAMLRSVPGSTFAEPLGLQHVDPSTLSSHTPGCWVSATQLAIGLDRGPSTCSQLSVVSWEAPPSQGAHVVSRVATFTPQSSGLGLRRVWSGLRGVEAPPNPILALTPLPPHHAHAGRFLVSLHADARLRIWDLTSSSGGGPCLGRASPLPACARQPTPSSVDGSDQSLSSSGDTSTAAVFLPLAPSGHTLRAFGHPAHVDKFVVVVCAAPRAPGRSVGAAKPTLLCGRFVDGRGARRSAMQLDEPGSASLMPRLLRGKAHAMALSSPSLWTHQELSGTSSSSTSSSMGVNPEEATATAFELRDASLALHPSSSPASEGALVWLLWQGEARRPFPIDGDDPSAYSEDPAIHTSQVAFARHAVRVTAHRPQWLPSHEANDDEDEALREGYDTNFSEPQPGDAPGQAAALSGDAASAAEARPSVGQQWAPSTSSSSGDNMSMLLPDGGSTGGVGFGGDHGGSASQIARADAAPLRACEPRYQHLRHRVVSSHTAVASIADSQQYMLGSSLATEVTLGASLLRWFVAELAHLERSMLGRVIAPGRFSDAALMRCLRSEDGPLPLACRDAVLPPHSAGTTLTRRELKRCCLGAMRTWACTLCPDLAALLASQRGSDTLLVGAGSASSQWSRAAAAQDWDALLPDPCGTLNRVGSCWLAFIGGCERMAAADRAAVALTTTSAADFMMKSGRSSTRMPSRSRSSNAPLVADECPLVVLANRIGVVSPLGKSVPIDGAGWAGGVGWYQLQQSSRSQRSSSAWLVSSAHAFEEGAMEAGWGNDFWERLDALVLTKTIDPNQKALGAAATGGAPKMVPEDQEVDQHHPLMAVHGSVSIIEATRNDLASTLVAARTADAGTGLLTPRAAWEEPLAAVASLLAFSSLDQPAATITQALSSAVASVWPPAPALASFRNEPDASASTASGVSDDHDSNSGATSLGPLALEATCSAALTVAAQRYRTSRTLMALLIAASADGASSSSGGAAATPSAATDAATGRAHVASEVQKCVLTLELACRFYALVLWLGRQPRPSSSGRARGGSYGGLRAVTAAPPTLWLAAGCASGFDPDDELLIQGAPWSSSMGLEGSSAGSLLLAFAEVAAPALCRRVSLCARAVGGTSGSTHEAGWLVDGLLAACAPRFPAPLGVGRDAFMTPRQDGTGRSCALLATWLQKKCLNRALNPVVDLARSALASASSLGYGEMSAHFNAISGSSFTVESAAKEHASLAALCLLDEAKHQGTTLENQAKAASHLEDVACQTLLQAAPSSLCVDAAASSLVDSKDEAGGFDQDDDDDMDLGGEDEEGDEGNLGAVYSAQVRDLSHMSQADLVHQWQAKNLTSAQTLDGGALSVALQTRTSLVALWAADAPSCLRFVVNLVRDAGRGRSSLPALWPQLLGWPKAQRAVLSCARLTFLDASSKLFQNTGTTSSTAMTSFSSSSYNAKSTVGGSSTAEKDALAARAVASGQGSSEARALCLVRAAMQAGYDFGAVSPQRRSSSSQVAAATSSALAPLGSLAFSLLLRLGAWTDAFRAIIATTNSSSYLLSATSRRAHMEQLTLSLCESGRLDVLVALPFDSQILDGGNASDSSIQAGSSPDGEVNLLRVADDFLAKESIVCQALSSDDGDAAEGADVGLSLDAPLNHTQSGMVVLDALAWHRARFSFSVSRGHWRSAAEGLYQLVQRISAQAPHRTGLLAHALRLCLSSLELAPKDRRFLTLRSMQLQPSTLDSMGASHDDSAAGLELVTIRSLKLEVAIAEARHTLQQANATVDQSHSIFGDDWSRDTYALAAAAGGSRDSVAATEVALALADKGYYSEACSLACALVAWDLSPVGVSVSGGNGNHKRRAMESLMADGSPLAEKGGKNLKHAGILAGASSSSISAPPPSSLGSDQHLGRRLLEDIVARLATTCVAFQHWAQPDSRELEDVEGAQQLSWDESKRPLLNVASEQSWTQGVRSNDWSGAAILPAHADYLHGASSLVHPHDVATAAAAAERCWGTRHAKSGWQLLQRLLKALDGPRWNFALTKAAAEAAVVAGCGRAGALPLWLQSRFLGDERANPKGLPTAAHRAAGNRRSSVPDTTGTGSGGGSGGGVKSGDGGALGGGADSAALLRSYLKAGLLNEALDLATALVVGATKETPKDNNSKNGASASAVVQVTAGDASAHLSRPSLSSRQPAAASGGGGWNEEAEILLPERGDAVWLPYSTFDQVLEVSWGLLEQHHAIASASFPGLETKVKEFEACLKAHFRKLITQEAFLGSARTIAKGMLTNNAR